MTLKAILRSELHISFKTADHHLIFNKTDDLFPKLWGQEHPKSWGRANQQRPRDPYLAELLSKNLHPSGSKRQDCHPSVSGWQSIQPKEIILETIFLRACLASFWTCLAPITPSFLISPFWNRMVYPMPVPPFWTCIICLISQIHSWRAICLRMNYTSNLIQIWFRWYLTETLYSDIRIDVEMN